MKVFVIFEHANDIWVQTGRLIGVFMEFFGLTYEEL